MHSEAPLPDEKLPPLQTLHTLPPDEEEKVPAAHRVQAEDAFSEEEPAVQASQVEASFLEPALQAQGHSLPAPTEDPV